MKTLLGDLMTEINKDDSLEKLFGHLNEWDSSAWGEILDGIDDSYIEAEIKSHGLIYSRLEAFVWIRDKIRSKGVDIDDMALAYLIFGGKK